MALHHGSSHCQLPIDHHATATSPCSNNGPIVVYFNVINRQVEAQLAAWPVPVACGIPAQLLLIRRAAHLPMYTCALCSLPSLPAAAAALC